VEWSILSNKEINIDFVELSLRKKDSELLKHLIRKERRRKRRIKKIKKKNNLLGSF